MEDRIKYEELAAVFQIWAFSFSVLYDPEEVEVLWASWIVVRKEMLLIKFWEWRLAIASPEMVMITIL